MGVKLLSSKFTRPNDTTSYTNGDLVANSTTAGSVVPLKFQVGSEGGQLVSIRMVKTDETDVASATFSLRLFAGLPTVANGDNGAISHDVASIIGIYPLTTMVAATDDAYSVLNIGDTNFSGGLYLPGVSTIYGLIEAKAAYSPAALEVFTVSLVVAPA